MLVALLALIASTEETVVNGEPLSAAQKQQLEARYNLRPAPGRYWYDRATGAFGHEGRETAGFLPPGLPISAALRADASNGRTGVFINGRQLHDNDVAAFRAAGIPVMAGRYWVDAAGNCGYEGGPAILNLFAMMNAAKNRGYAGSRSSKVYGSPTGNDRNWSGGDGKGGAYFSDSKGNLIITGSD